MSIKPLRPYAKSVGTTCGQLLPAHVGRRQFVLRNIGSYDVYFSTVICTLAGGVEPGFLLKAGEVVQMSQRDFDDTESQYFAIADTGASTVLVIA